MRPSIIASVFFGFYESAEIRFAEKYHNGNSDVIELGGSCGVVTSHLVSKLQSGNRLISVEANKNLRVVWEENTRRANHHSTELILINEAIHYHSATVNFHISNDTTESSAVTGETIVSNAVELPAVTLGEVVDRYKISNYTLVCDIEGAEAQVFLHERTSLQSCHSILIELHDTVYKNEPYSVGRLSELIKALGFNLIENHGPVHYFKRTAKTTRNQVYI